MLLNMYVVEHPSKTEEEGFYHGLDWFICFFQETLCVSNVSFASPTVEDCMIEYTTKKR